MSLTGGFGGANSISSDNDEQRHVLSFYNWHTNYEHAQCAKIDLFVLVRHIDINGTCSVHDLLDAVIGGAARVSFLAMQLTATWEPRQSKLPPSQT